MLMVQTINIIINMLYAFIMLAILMVIPLTMLYAFIMLAILMVIPLQWYNH